MSLREQPSRQMRPSVTSHPLFPVAVPLWFGALFSLSTLAIRGSLLEEWVLASQLDLVLPMAAPPLGFTARLLVGIAFGVIGALIGKGLVRLLMAADQDVPQAAAGQAYAPAYASPAGEPEIRLRERDTHPDAPARRPISAHAELGEDGFGPVPVGTPAGAPAYTPAFTYDSDDGAGDEPERPESLEPLPAFLQPQPAVAAWPEPVAVPVAQPVIAPAVAPETAPQPLVAASWPPVDAPGTMAAPALFEPVEPAPEPLPAPEPAPETAPEPTAAPAQAVAAPPPQPVSQPAPAALTAAQRIAGAPLEKLSHVELIERLAIGMQRRREREALRRAGLAASPVLAPPPPAATPAQTEADWAQPHAAEPDSEPTAAGLRAALASLRRLT